MGKSVFSRRCGVWSDLSTDSPSRGVPGERWHEGGSGRTRAGARLLIVMAVVMIALGTGCATGPKVLSQAEQKMIDRRIMEYPTGFDLTHYIEKLDSPTGFCFDDSGNLIIAEGGLDEADPRILGVHPDGTPFKIYPFDRRIPLFKPGYRIYGPVGGVLASRGKIYVSCRDHLGMGQVIAFGYDGSHSTVVADLPARGDYGMTDLAISPVNGRIYFGVGTATNSGVVGLDNFDEGWVREYPDVCDVPYKNLRLTGFRFNAKNPDASIFVPDIAVTSPFQPFGTSNITQIPASPMGKPTGAIYSISPEGGDLRVEAWGVRNPVGMAVNEFGRVYFSDQGMELRGTRPLKDDPDGLFRLVTDAWYGFPDYSRSLEPIGNPKFQPQSWMVIFSGYPEVAAIIDHAASGLVDPDRRWIAGQFAPLAGAAKMDFVPQSGSFHDFRGNLVVAMWGNRAPFATNHQPLKSPPSGFSVVRVDPDSHEVHNFVFNTVGGPASQLREGRDVAMERPIDVKFGPDGALYILDFGRMEMKDGHEKVIGGTGKIFRLAPAASGATRP